uniref:Uncharacterized protein n=1 Tax=Ascaris lumbricoides TaxID=6252 RepID=A0A0M3I605_ASCLU
MFGGAVYTYDTYESGQALYFAAVDSIRRQSFATLDVNNSIFIPLCSEMYHKLLVLWQLNEKLLARMGKVTTIISSAADAIATELYAETLSEQSVAKQSRILRLAVIADLALEKAKRWIFVSAAAGDEFC